MGSLPPFLLPDLYLLNKTALTHKNREERQYTLESSLVKEMSFYYVTSVNIVIGDVTTRNQ